MIKDTERVLHDHIVECSQNYATLEGIVVAQNQKIDTLAAKIHEIHSFLTGAVGYLIVGLLGIIGWGVQHFIIK
ncbi:hypothetical protein P0D69_28100 [Paraburkholderia sediminicola]|uniref:hypothetical protein n=1 Tax=Paraburkholderia sediminicola TaxID=458836 RepID=UPI0038B85272